MTVVQATPPSALAASARAARAQARQQRKAASRLRAWTRRLMATLALVFAVLGFGGGTAQAWPWDVGENVTAFITNFCGPQDVRGASTFAGPDNMFGLNEYEADTRRTILPNTNAEGVAGTGEGQPRIQAGYVGDDREKIIHPTYERYGFSTLKWTTYGAGCFDYGRWTTAMANLLLQGMVYLPLIVTMGFLQLVLSPDNWLYQVFSDILDHLVGAFADVFLPWTYVLVPVGVLLTFIIKRRLQEVFKAAAWGALMVGVVMWWGNSSSQLVTYANNIVTNFAGTAAAKITEASSGNEQDPVTDEEDPTKAINQALWYSIAYQTWAVGEVGPAQAKEDFETEEWSQVGWAPAILNGLYLGTTTTENENGTTSVALDKEAKDVSKSIEDWNSASYAPETDGFIDDAETKPSRWTDDDIWRKVPFLFTVGAMCNDPMDGAGGGTADAEKNRWMYGGSCDAAGAGTEEMIPHVKGEMLTNQSTTIFSGSVSAFSAVAALLVASVYLGFQKVMFYLFLVAAPMILAVSSFGTDSLRRFGYRYFELMAANVIKQCGAVLAVLFIANAMSALLIGGDTATNMPIMLKPFAAILFFLALLFFMFPLLKVVKAAAKGDASVVDRIYHAPKDVSKNVAKGVAGTALVAGTAGLGLAGVAATGTKGAALAGAAAKTRNAAGLLRTAGRAMNGTKVGKNLSRAGNAMYLGSRMGDLAGSKVEANKVRDAALGTFLNSEEGKEFKENLSRTPGMVATDGSLTSRGQKEARKFFSDKVASAHSNGEAEAKQAKMMGAFFKQHKYDKGAEVAKAHGLKVRSDGSVDPEAAAAVGAPVDLDEKNRPMVYHSEDPQNPEVKAAKAARAEGKRDEQARAALLGDGSVDKARAAAAKAGQVPSTIPVDDETGLPKDPALAAAVRAGVPLKVDGSVADVKAAREAGILLDEQGRPVTPEAARAQGLVDADGKPLAGAVALSGNVAAKGMVAAETPSETQEAMAAKVRDRFDGPAFARDTDTVAEGRISGEGVLAANGLTEEDMVRNPERLLTGKAYGGGNLTKMDPSNPATAALADLQFAMAHGTDEEIEEASQAAAVALAHHGAPDQITRMGLVGDSAAAFNEGRGRGAGELIAAMPVLDTDSTWTDRAEAAKTASAIASSLPVDHSAREAVEQYASAVANPRITVEEVSYLKGEALEALDAAHTAEQSTGATPAFAVPNTGDPAADYRPMYRAASSPMDAVDAQAEQARVSAAMAPFAGVQEHAQQVMALSPQYNEAIGALEQDAAGFPEGHPAQQALQTYAVTATDPQATMADKQAALEHLTQEVNAGLGDEVHTVPTVTAVAATGAAAATLAADRQAGGDRFPANPDFQASVAHRAAELGAVPAENGTSLGYATTIGGVEYTSASRAPLDALNHHAEQVVEAVTVADGGGYRIDEGYADERYSGRVAHAAEQFYGAVPVADGQPSRGYSTTIDGVEWTASSEDDLHRFRADLQEFTGSAPSSQIVMDGGQFALRHAADLRASDMAASRVVSHGAHALENGSPTVQAADQQYAQTVQTIGQEHYGVVPVSDGHPSLGATAMVNGVEWTAADQGALQRFSADVDTFATSAPHPGQANEAQAALHQAAATHEAQVIDARNTLQAPGSVAAGTGAATSPVSGEMSLQQFHSTAGAIGQAHYGVTPVTTAADVQECVMEIEGRHYTADSSEKLLAFESDLNAYTPQGHVGQGMGADDAIYTPGQRAFYDLGTHMRAREEMVNHEGQVPVEAPAPQPVAAGAVAAQESPAYGAPQGGGHHGSAPLGSTAVEYDQAEPSFAVPAAQHDRVERYERVEVHTTHPSHDTGATHAGNYPEHVVHEVRPADTGYTPATPQVNVTADAPEATPANPAPETAGTPRVAGTPTPQAPSNHGPAGSRTTGYRKTRDARDEGVAGRPRQGVERQGATPMGDDQDPADVSEVVGKPEGDEERLRDTWLPRRRRGSAFTGGDEDEQDEQE